MSTYEPGTVAVATVRGVPNVRVFRYCCIDGKGYWDSAVPVDDMIEHADDEVTDVSPLVTLNPEDREQVERLVRTWLATDGDVPTRHGINAMRAALRSLLAPPKPEEPTGLGAVVEDSKGVRWVRTHIELDAHWRSGDFQGRYDEWRHIDAIRVLSEGVTA